MKSSLIVIMIIALLAIVGVTMSLQQPENKPVACTKEAMVCPDGSAVGREGPNCEFAKCPEPVATSTEPAVITTPIPTPAPKKCFVGGCSSQLCSDTPGMVSTCEYREEYACYKTAKCERQVSGQCGWTDSPELTMCIDNAR